MKKFLTAVNICALAMGITACSSTPDQPQRPERSQQRPPSFAELDSNGDGKLDRDEMSQLPSRRVSPDEIFNRIDQNGDGYIDQSEFTRFRENMRKRSQERQG